MLGLDKTTITGILVEQIDLEKLLGNTITFFTEGAVMEVPTISGTMQKIAYLKIKDNKMFNQFQLGVKLGKGKTINYCFLTLANNTTGNNLNPITIDEYRTLINKVKQYLQEQYGLYVNMDNANFREIEINLTMEIKQEFVEWEYLIKLMRKLAPRRYFAEEDHARFKKFTGIVLSNDSVRIKIYDKTRQLKDVYNINLSKNYLRIEYKLLNANKIKQVLGTNLVSELEDERIHMYLKNQIIKDMLTPLQMHINKSNKLLLKMAKDKRSKNIRNWVNPFLNKARFLEDNNIPVLIDVEQLETIIKKLTGYNATATLQRQQNTLNGLLNKYSNFSKIGTIKSFLL